MKIISSYLDNIPKWLNLVEPHIEDKILSIINIYKLNEVEVERILQKHFSMFFLFKNKNEKRKLILQKIDNSFAIKVTYEVKYIIKGLTEENKIVTEKILRKKQQYLISKFSRICDRWFYIGLKLKNSNCRSTNYLDKTINILDLPTNYKILRNKLKIKIIPVAQIEFVPQNEIEPIYIVGNEQFVFGPDLSSYYIDFKKMWLFFGVLLIFMIIALLEIIT